ncbi:MAG: glycosyltransferase family 4 protein [Acidobacteria bacterium]|nr:glycosyltransferase family 4 protein [Acidobacteriota bacterium]
MRLAIINWSNRKVGGAEKYLADVIPELAKLGHTVAFWHEVDEPLERERIALPDGAPMWCVSELGAARALAALRAWEPDLIYAHGLLDPELEAETMRLAPSVFLAHAYYGMCISGTKTFKSPNVEPCDRRFGLKCLAHYYPRRCGGLNPLTMWSDFRTQSKRLKLLQSYDAVLTLSEHMRNECLKHGIIAERAFDLPALKSPLETQADSATTELRARDAWRLLFVGRMDFLKGGHLLLEALPQVQSTLARTLRVTFAGDGPERKSLEAQAARLQSSAQLRIDFTGWVDRARLDALLEETDLLVFPSLWPEPFGLIGPEAGTHGVPVAAFASGGTRDWLIDGVNGYLAAGDPPTAEGLAQAMIKCLRSPAVHQSLRHRAREIAGRFTQRNHLTALSHIFEQVLEGRV